MDEMDIRHEDDNELDELDNLFQAIYNKDVVKLQNLLRTVQNINEVDDFGTALLAAVQCNDLEMVDILTRSGADVNIFGRHFKPLESAMQNFNPQMVRLLLKRGGDIFKVHVYETEEVHRSNALNDAFKIGSCFKKFGVEEYVRMMLDHDDGLSDLATKAAYALSAAAAIGDAERVKMYLEHGVKVEDCLKVETHPLLNACKNEHVSVVKILLENGGVGINDTDTCSDSWPPRQSPMSWAIGRRNRQILRLLLTKGAHSAGKPLDDCGEEGPSISGLMLACIYNYRDMVKEVLSDSHIEVNWVNEEGMTALHYSCFRFMGDYIVSGTNATKNTDENERLGIVKDLLVAGASNPSADNCSPLELHLQ